MIKFLEKVKREYNMRPYNYELESDSDGLRLHIDYDLIAKNDLNKRQEFINRNSWYGLSPYGEMENLMGKYCEDAVFGVRNAKPEITNVIYNYPATIVFWSDGDKTVVKCDGDVWDEEKGLAMAIAKKFLGTNKNKSNYYDVFKKWAKPDSEINLSTVESMEDDVKCCKNCKYTNFSSQIFPCNICSNLEHWEVNVK